MNALTRVQGALLVTLVLVGSAGVVRAGTTYYVDDDGVADFKTIQEAVDAAASGDTVVLQPGTYTGSGNWDIVIAGKILTITSVDPNNPAVVADTVIDCQSRDVNGHRAFETSDGTGAVLRLAGLTIVNSSKIVNGGAVLCEGATLRVTNCTFANHKVEWWGGAVHCLFSDAAFQGCTFSNNTSTASTGGAVSAGNSVVSFINCTFESNTGNALVSLDSNATLVDCAFERNVGKDGGAIYSYTSYSDATAYATTTSSKQLRLNMTRCTFVENAANASGGALLGINAQGTITGCTFTANTARVDGGALWLRRSSPAITNCVFVANVADGIGGAIANVYESSPQTINCTFVSNEAAGGGAIASKYNGNPLISHSILWDNVAPQGKNLYLMRVEGGIGYLAKATIEYSDIENGPASALVDPGCTLTWSPGNINANPLFTGPFRDDYHLSTDSPCIDAGSPDYLPDPGATDLDGYPRLYGSVVDLGAYEYQGLGPVYRFWSPVKYKHFYTISGAERDSVLNLYPHIFNYEDVAFYAYYHRSEENLIPVYRFWSPSLEAHFWTTDEAEKMSIITELADVWVYEGVVFYAYPSGKQPLGTFPVYRFWSGKLGQHFYTIDEAEKDALIINYPDVWSYEGVAWYAFTKPFQPRQITYDFRGGADSVWYALTLKAYIDGKEALMDAADVQLAPSSAEMRMSVDFTNLKTTFNTLRVRTQTTQHVATISTVSGAVTIPFALSIDATFTALTQRGPFAINPATGVFADFAKANQNLTAKQATYTYNGTATLGAARVNFARVSDALQFELQSFGTFEGINLVPDGIYARMPLTFQWHRPYVKDLLAEALVDGRLVQIYVTYAYVGTQGLWEGQAIE